MDNNYYDEDEINLLDIIKIWLRNMVKMIAVALALGIVAGACKFALLKKPDKDTGLNGFDTYNIALEDYNVEKDYLNFYVDYIDDKINNAKEGKDTSIISNWDSPIVYRASKSYSINNIDVSMIPNMGDTNTLELAKNTIANQYSNIWSNIKIYDYFGLDSIDYLAKKNSEIASDSIFTMDNALREIITFNVSNDNITIYAYGETEKSAEELLNKIASSMPKMRKEVMNLSYTFDLADTTSVTTTTTTIGELQQNKEKSINDLTVQKLKAKEDIKNLKHPKSPKRQIAIFFIVGCFIGGGSMAAYYLIDYLLKETIENNNVIGEKYNIEYIGSRKENTDEFINERIRILSKDYKKITKNNSISFNNDVDALKELENSDAIILEETLSESSLKDVDRVVAFCKKINKPIIGYIIK